MLSNWHFLMDTWRISPSMNIPCVYNQLFWDLHGWRNIILIGGGEILTWSDQCKENCFITGNHLSSHIIGTLSIPESEIPALDKVPECYHDLRKVFSKSWATSLLPHRPYDCTIDLLPGTWPPEGQLYSILLPETSAMKGYIQSSLEAGIIRPSSSPVGAGFFCSSARRMNL